MAEVLSVSVRILLPISTAKERAVSNWYGLSVRRISRLAFHDGTRAPPGTNIGTFLHSGCAPCSAGVGRGRLGGGDRGGASARSRRLEAGPGQQLRRGRAQAGARRKALPLHHGRDSPGRVLR